MDRIAAARVFVDIAERGSMTAAARALDMSRAMVTRYLAEMEEWAGSRLLHRSTRRLSLTPVGEETLRRCRDMLDIAEAMTVNAGAMADSPRGTVRLTCAQSLAQSYLAGVVTDYLRRYPGTRIDLVLSAQALNLIDERIDIAIRITNDLDPNLITRKLARCQSIVCAAPSYLAAAGTPTRVEQLSNHNCLTYSHFSRSLWQFDVAGETVAVPVSGNLNANEPGVLLAAALRGAGVVMQPLYEVSPLLHSGRLVQLLPACRPQELGVHAVYTSRRQMLPIVRTLLDFLVERFSSDPGWQVVAA